MLAPAAEASSARCTRRASPGPPAVRSVTRQRMEVYLAAHAARAAPVRVDVLPARPGTPSFAPLDARGDTILRTLWADLARAGARFATTRRPPPFGVDAAGRYLLR